MLQTKEESAVEEQPCNATSLPESADRCSHCNRDCHSPLGLYSHNRHCSTNWHLHQRCISVTSVWKLTKANKNKNKIQSFSTHKDKGGLEDLKLTEQAVSTISRPLRCQAHQLLIPKSKINTWWRWWWWQFIEREYIHAEKELRVSDHNHQVDFSEGFFVLFFVAYGACWVCLCWHNPPNSDMDYRVFIVHTDVNACDCTRGCTDAERESALTVDYVKKIPCSTWESDLTQRRDGPML